MRVLSFHLAVGPTNNVTYFKQDDLPHGSQLAYSICNSSIYPVILITKVVRLAVIEAINGIQIPVPCHQC